MAPTRVAIAGSTGSIGGQTLEIISADPDAFDVVGLSAGRSAAVIIEQAKTFRPAIVAVADPTARNEVSEALSGLSEIEVVADATEMCDIADVVINGVVGFAGLPVTMATLSNGRRLGLANKESLIAAGPVVQPLREVDGAELVPVDSEHCALHQCLRSSIDTNREVSRLVLTASGGPFRGRSAAELANVTVDEALRHPTWSMGPKITIDSSTLMNKGLEVIEAHELFGTPFDEIDVVVHPQSVVHSMVEFADGSTIAQLSMPDMRLPIGYALGWPHRLGIPFGTIDWTQLSQLNFEPPDRSTFKCLDLAYAAGRAGGTAPAVISAANEIAVDAFIDGEITWAQIHDVSAAVLDSTSLSQPSTVDEVIDADRRAREDARRVISGMLA
ncbi:MAG: 1-deoxy-D-xylulose-5-phosphate reductoisomerase [Ilumatobacteraceae bacterium]|nr:1-deoxy-D-xylulose-5-phosphate reductoisomerase [Ilumatobacteraceae bacterium]